MVSVSEMLASPRVSGRPVCLSSPDSRPKRRVFTFNTDTTGLDVATTDVLSVAIVDVASGEHYTTLVNPRLADPAAELTTGAAQEAAGIHGLQEAEILADGIHVLDAFADLTAFVNERLQPGEQAVIAAHGGFGFHFPVLELASQRALQQAAAAGFAAIPGPEAAAWPKDWLFQDTLMLDWALQSLTQELRTEHGLFEPLDRRANRLQLADTHALLVHGQAAAVVRPTGRDRSLMQARMVSRIQPVLLNLLQPRLRPVELGAVLEAHTCILAAQAIQLLPALGAVEPRRYAALQEWLDLLQRHRGWLLQPWQLNGPNNPAGRFPTWRVHRLGWGWWDAVLKALPSAMMSAAKINARVDALVRPHELDASVVLAQAEPAAVIL